MMMEEVALEEGVVVEEEVHPSGGVVPGYKIERHSLECQNQYCS